MPTVSQALTYASAASNTTGTTTASFTPLVGDILVVSTVAEGVMTTTAPTSTGLTFTSQTLDATASTCSTQQWTAPVGTGGARTVTMGALGGAGWHSAICWVVTPSVAGTLSVGANKVDTRGSGAPSATLTALGSNSVICWSNGDFAAVSPATNAYRSSAVEDFKHDKSPTFYVADYAHQAVSATGAQTIGLTAPAGQTFKIVGVEIIETGGAAASLPDLVMAPIRR